MWESISRLTYDTQPQFPIGKRIIIVIKKHSPVLHSLRTLAEACTCHELGELGKVCCSTQNHQSPYFPLEVYTSHKCTKGIWKQFVLAVNLYVKPCRFCMTLRAKKKERKIVQADNVFDTEMIITLDRFLWAGNAICLVGAESKDHCSPWKDCL